MTSSSVKNRALCCDDLPQDPENDGRVLPLLAMRPVSSMEPRGYLAHPRFSNCTVPVVWVPRNQHNMGHVVRGAQGRRSSLPWYCTGSRCRLTGHSPGANPPPHAADSAAQLYPGLQATPWRRHIKLVVQTPEGLAMSDMVQVLLGSLTNMSTETLADFSSRLPEGDGGGSSVGSTAAASGAAALPASYEGGEQRCFQQLFVCGNRTLGQPYTQWAFGQHVVAHLQRQGLVPPTPPRCGAACGGGGSGGESGGQQGLLRVRFHKRIGHWRQLLNAAELLERCNAWQYHPEVRGTSFRGACDEVRLLRGAAVGRRAVCC